MVNSTVFNGTINGKPRSGRILRHLKPRKYDDDYILPEPDDECSDEEITPDPDIGSCKEEANGEPANCDDSVDDDIGEDITDTGEVEPEIDPERQILAEILHAGKLDPSQVNGLRMDEFDDMEYGDLYFLMGRTPPPLTPKKIAACDAKKAFGWDEEDILELKHEHKIDVTITDLADEIRKRFLCRTALSYIQGIKQHAKTGDLNALRSAVENLANNVKYTGGTFQEFDEGIWIGDLLQKEIKTEWLITDVLVANQHGIIGALSKTMKTSLAVDMAIAVVTGTKFLDHFQVTAPAPVAMWSGESGAANIQDLTKRIAEARHLDLADAKFRCYFRLPQLNDAAHLARFRGEILKHGIKVAIVDPLYLCMHTEKTASQAGNIFMSGALLREITKIGQETGCTIVLLHHFRKSVASKPLDDAGMLEDLAQAGLAEWARQWILLKRREKYACDGEHRLWASVGGSAGHSAEYALNISEGKLPNRTWNMTVSGAYEMKAAIKGHSEQLKHFALEAEEQQRMADVLEALKFAPETQNGLKENHLGWNKLVIARVCNRLVNEKLAEITPVKKHTSTTPGYKILPKGLDFLAKKAEESAAEESSGEGA